MPTVLVLDADHPAVAADGTGLAERLVEQLRSLAGAGQAPIDGEIQRVGLAEVEPLLKALERGRDLVLVDGGLVAHTMALRLVVGDGRLGDALLVARDERPASATTLAEGALLDREARVVQAIASPIHELRRANASSRGVLRLSAATAVAVGTRLAEELRTCPTDVQRALRDDPTAVIAALAIEEQRRIRPVLLRGLEAHRVRTPEAARDALKLCHDHDEERAWLDAAVKEKDGWFTTFLVSPYSRYLARWAARWRLSPNQVTILSALVAVFAAVAFGVGTLPWNIVGAVLLQVSFTLDCVDGQLSRYTQTFSDLGAWLDSMLDRAKELLVYLGLAVGGVRAGEDTWLLLVGATAMLVLRHSVDLTYERAQPQAPLVPALRREPMRGLGSGQWRAASERREAPSDAPKPADGRPPHLANGEGSRGRVSMWLLRILGFPIGERLAVVSLLAIFAERRVLFLTLIAWGLLAWGASTGLKGLRARRWPSGRWSWMSAAVPRIAEYGLVVGLVAFQRSAGPAAFAFLTCLAVRHYDEGYRGRAGATGKGDRLARAVLSRWELRVIALVLGALSGSLIPVLWALAGFVSLIALLDLSLAWLRTEPTHEEHAHAD